VLEDVARAGMPGDHHFYISFRTEAPGVRLSPRLRERYPEEMTIVMQFQFWDLTVTEQAFEVGLSFGGVPERLFVPFDSITGFHDPSVNFGLKFEPFPDETAANADGPAAADAAPALEQAHEADPPIEADDPASGAEILSLDKFRKK
jgi:hypothetical protein